MQSTHHHIAKHTKYNFKNIYKAIYNKTFTRDSIHRRPLCQLNGWPPHQVLSHLKNSPEHASVISKYLIQLIPSEFTRQCQSLIIIHTHDEFNEQ